MNKSEYKQSIAFHPGEYIRDLIEEMELTQSEFAKRLDVSAKVLSELVNCKTPMNKDIAENLATMTGTSVTVWLNLQFAYDAAISENKSESVDMKLEKIADLFALSSFISIDDYIQFISESNFTRQSILDFAGQMGIHSGIVVGRLQHDRFVDFRSLNDLRVRYQIQ